MTTPVTRAPRPGAVVRGAGLTHRGCLRDVNEDSILTDPSGALWAVADGMGGYGHGDLAAGMVIERLAAIPHGGGDGLVPEALAAADAAIRARARAEGLGTMGTTIVVAVIANGRAVVFWVGDSRAYRLGAGALTRLTRDHSVVQELIDRGQLAAAAAEQHPQAHVVTRAIGTGGALEIDRVEVELAPGDVLVLCSDGLTRCLTEPEIAAIVAADPEPETACRRLVEAALAAGAPDNVSVIAVRICGSGPQ